MVSYKKLKQQGVILPFLLVLNSGCKSNLTFISQRRGVSLGKVLNFTENGDCYIPTATTENRHSFHLLDRLSKNSEIFIIPSINLDLF